MMNFYEYLQLRTNDKSKLNEFGHPLADLRNKALAGMAMGPVGLAAGLAAGAVGAAKGIGSLFSDEEDDFNYTGKAIENIEKAAFEIQKYKIKIGFESLGSPLNFKFKPLLKSMIKRYLSDGEPRYLQNIISADGLGQLESVIKNHMDPTEFDQIFRKVNLQLSSDPKSKHDKYGYIKDDAGKIPPTAGVSPGKNESWMRGVFGESPSKKKYDGINEIFGLFKKKPAPAAAAAPAPQRKPPVTTCPFCRSETVFSGSDDSYAPTYAPVLQCEKCNKYWAGNKVPPSGLDPKMAKDSDTKMI